MIPDHLGGHLDFTAMLVPTFQFIKNKYNIKSMLDVGCGPAGMVEYANYDGVYALGIDGDFSLPKKDYVLFHDFTTGKIELNKKFDLIYTTEFFEHVDKIHMHNFLCLFENAKYAFVSAAPPGQGGHHHVNEQSKQFWIDILEEYGLTYLAKESDEISLTSEDNLVRKNSMFFVNKNFDDNILYETPFHIDSETIENSKKRYFSMGGPKYA
jgi:SAM-dependent methyltransferase